MFLLHGGVTFGYVTGMVCYYLGCSYIRIPVEVIAAESRMNGSLWG